MSSRGAWILATVLAFVLAGTACGESTPADAVHVLRLRGEIDPVTERFVDRGIARAEDSHARVIIIELDTPGGLSSSMRTIVQRIERAKVPVVVFVSPTGARAASAGTFIAMAAHVAAMAPNTSIGAASAINSNGSDIQGTLGRKVENDAVSFIRGIAELRGRNADWAEQAVRQAVSATQSQALDLNVIDLVANDRTALINALEGRTVQIQPGTTVTLSGLAGAPLVTTKMTFFERFTAVFANPTLASILLTLGLIAMAVELAHPGLILPGVAGVMMLILAFLGFGELPVDTAGLLLMTAGLVFLALEVVVTSGGVLGVGGAAAIILGGIIAFRDTPADIRPSYLAVVVVVALGAVMLFFAVASLARVRTRAVTDESQRLIGKTAEVRLALSPEGVVRIKGERWPARIESGSATPGERVRVVAAEGGRLRVARLERPKT
jgi:membrane-bound serine protease (ClpP class)